MSIGWIVWEIGVCIIDQLLVTYLLLCHLGYSKPTKKPLIIGFLLAVTILVLKTFLTIDSKFVVAISLATNMAFAFFIFGGSVSARLFWGVVPTILFSVAEAVLFNIFASIDPAVLEKGMEKTELRMQMQCIYIMITCAIFYLVAQIGRKRSILTHYPFPAKAYIVVSTGLAVFSMQLLTDIPFHYSNIENPEFMLRAILIIGIILIAIVIGHTVIISMLGIMNQRNIDNIEEISRMKQQKEFMTNAEANYEFLRTQRHDMKSHIQTMSILLEQEKYSELKDYFASYVDGFDNIPLLVLTNDTPVNACLTAKANRAQSAGIQFEQKIMLSRDFPIASAEMCALLSNMLDNAIEANHSAAVQNRYIRLEMTEQDDMLKIHMENSADGVYNIAKKKLFTKKTEPNHGLGIRQMERIVQNTGGYLVTEPQPDKFAITAMLPIG